MLTLEVPTLNRQQVDHRWMFDAHTALTQERGQGVAFDFSKCGFIRHNGVAFLGGLARDIQRRGGRISFKWETLQPKVRESLATNGFMATMNGSVPLAHAKAIPYREDRSKQERDFADFLASKWLERGWENIEETLRDHVASRIGELYVNAFQHSESQLGTFTCGQHFPDLGTLELTIADFGVGIPAKVQKAFAPDPVSPSDCLQWAMRRGNSTNNDPSDSTRGLGLSLFEDFVKTNDGWLEIYTKGGYALVNKSGSRFRESGVSFGGTLINIGIKCDATRYTLKAEPDDVPIF